MTRAARLRAPYIAVALFTALAGDVWRYTLGWAGWGVLVGLLVAAGIWMAVALRADLRRIPIPLALFAGLAAASTAWSAYPGATALGVLLLVAPVAIGSLIATTTSRAELLDLLAIVLRILMLGSLAFEAVVAIVVRQPVFPLWTDYPEGVPKAFMWSRALLLEGGRIQGLVGNSNLLGMLALLALIVLGIRLAVRRAGRGWDAAGLVAAAACLLLTRSSTVIVAALAVAVVLALVLLARRLGGRGRIALGVATGLGLVAAAGTGVALRETIAGLLGRSPDLTGRLDIWAAVVDLALQRPVLGWGWVGYWPPWVAPFDELAIIDGVRYLQAHDAWLDLWFQLGIGGVLAFGAVLVTAIARAVRLAVGPRGEAAAAPAAGAAPARPGALELLPLLVLAALAVQSIAESRILVEGGLLLLVILGVQLLPARPAGPDAAPASPAGSAGSAAGEACT
ncbi:O-antigen ligase family protein [Homoserinibacter sp. YIM 151385]|uniref:O-antigen ligase family protein n=1 Tax=Homoserinibacter sp. YIM 151385 TaxID=2985506 RepID=UPI0022F126FA|nr:O-antigen ligase family protein [Homoserinibacter sp. YIM 151385]WBU37788.1 O-antigen ligase family protein [Homoserinibacter sp. YIM 151385]